MSEAGDEEDMGQHWHQTGESMGWLGVRARCTHTGTGPPSLQHAVCFCLRGFGLKVKLVQKSRHHTLGNTGRWLGLRVILPLLGMTRQQPGKRLAAHPWLLHKQLGKYNIMLCISSLKMPKSRQLAENNCINKALVYCVV